MAFEKSIHSIILDAGPLLTNDPSISTLLAKCEKIYTIPAVISEIKDPVAKARFDTLVNPFIIKDRLPSPASIKVVSDFARRTGDLQVLSRPDIQILALAYELECERNGGDWRLRRVPGQKRVNGAPPMKQETTNDGSTPITGGEKSQPDSTPRETSVLPSRDLQGDQSSVATQTSDIVETLAEVSVAGSTPQESDNTSLPIEAPDNVPEDAAELDNTIEEISEDSNSDSDGWITPSNLKKQQLKDLNGSSVPEPEPKVMQVATITGDFAMQNILLQMNLNLLSPSLLRVRHLKTYILRCHACFDKTKDMTKQFCPRCGKPTLTRVACSTNANGEFKLHLKKNMQWNTRGDRFSIPKPIAGQANGKIGQTRGGGKGGWGQELILAEDQKEYLHAMKGQSRQKERNLMDEDYLPSILTGDRGSHGGRPKVGGGRNVNSKKR